MLEFNTGSFDAGNSETFIDLSMTMTIETNLYSRIVQGNVEPDISFGLLAFDSPREYETRYELGFGLEMQAVPTEISIETDLSAFLGFDVNMDPLSIPIETEILSKPIRELSERTEVSIETSIESKVAYYQQSYLELNGEFKPGDRIVIDASRLSITKNGENALHLLSGGFFDLNLGPNSIVYTDDAGARNITMRVAHRDRHI